MARPAYDPSEIEPRWQRVWDEEGAWEVSNDGGGDRPKAYVLEMLPYPSGEPHIGHLKTYSVGDAIAHFRRRNGFRVLHPMGYDAFGLPAENHAIKTGEHPRDSTQKSIEAFQRQFRQWGISIDWTREFGTHEPRYYRWTQWIFLQLLERGLAYRQEAAVKWCPNDATVLANEQVVDGRCERCGAEVEVRQLEQWFLRITDYADRLLDDLDTIDWPAHVKTMQRNWIGRSEGAEVVFRCEEMRIDYPVFTTRPDTLFGATFFVLAPEHPDVMRLAAGTDHEHAVRAYVNHALTESNSQRGDADKPKTGVPLGRTVTNPVNGEQLPMLVADYVLMEYGTGAIMAVPAHDERDHAFARAFELPIREVISGGDDVHQQAYAGDGALVNSAPQFDGRPNREALVDIVAWLDREGKGHASVNYRLRDWLISRQRYWGCPIPVVYCDSCGIVPVPDERPAGRAARRRGLRPARTLAAGRRRGLGAHAAARSAGPTPARDRHHGHVRRLLVVLPALLRRPQRRGRLGPAGRSAAGCPSTSTSAASSTRSCTCCTRASSARRWPTSACWTSASPSPPCSPRAWSLATGPRCPSRGATRSTPAHIFDRYGADTARCYILFIGPPDQDVDWSDEGVEGVHRFLARLWRLGTETARDAEPADLRTSLAGDDLVLLRKAHWAIDKVTQDMGRRFAFNTAIAAVMELVNECSRLREDVEAGSLRFALATAASLVFPFAPQCGADVYDLLTGRQVWRSPGRRPTRALLERDTFQLVCQVNGKLRDRLEAPASASDAELLELARQAPNVRAHLDGREVVKEIVVPGKLVNLVVR